MGELLDGGDPVVDAVARLRADSAYPRATVDMTEHASGEGRQMEQLESSRATVSAGTVVSSTTAKTSLIPLDAPGAYDGSPGGGGTVCRSLCRAKS